MYELNQLRYFFAGIILQAGFNDLIFAYKTQQRYLGQ